MKPTNYIEVVGTLCTPLPLHEHSPCSPACYQLKCGTLIDSLCGAEQRYALLRDWAFPDLVQPSSDSPLYTNLARAENASACNQLCLDSKKSQMLQGANCTLWRYCEDPGGCF